MLQRSQQKGIDECPWVLRYGCLCDTGEQSKKCSDEAMRTDSLNYCFIEVIHLIILVLKKTCLPWCDLFIIQLISNFTMADNQKVGFT